MPKKTQPKKTGAKNNYSNKSSLGKGVSTSPQTPTSSQTRSEKADEERSPWYCEAEDEADAIYLQMLAEEGES